jgi:hypothetical protein
MHQPRVTRASSAASHGRRADHTEEATRAWLVGGLFSAGSRAVVERGAVMTRLENAENRTLTRLMWLG